MVPSKEWCQIETVTNRHRQRRLHWCQMETVTNRHRQRRLHWGQMETIIFGVSNLDGLGVAALIHSCVPCVGLMVVGSIRPIGKDVAAVG